MSIQDDFFDVEAELGVDNPILESFYRLWSWACEMETKIDALYEERRELLSTIKTLQRLGLMEDD